MSSEVIVCLGCQRSYSTSTKRAGRTIKCWCGQSITFPEGELSAGAAIPHADDQDIDPAMEDRQDRAGFMGHLIMCLLLSIPLSFIGIAIHPVYRSKKPKSPLDALKGFAFIIIVVGTIVGFTAILTRMNLTFDKLNQQEFTLALCVAIGGGLLTLIVTALRPLIGFLCAAVALGGMYLACQHIQDNRRALTAALLPHVAHYAHLIPTMAGYTGSDRINFAGKMIVVDTATDDIDNMYYLMPPELQARDANDVGTIVWIKRGEEALGQYAGHAGKAIRRFADVTFIDNSNPGKLVFNKRFIGGDPPTRGKDADQYGSVPDSDIITFIQSRQRT